MKDPGRVGDVIAQINAEVIGLQEVESSPASVSTQPYSFLPPGYTIVSGSTLFREDVSYGNLLLTSLPVVDVALHDLSVAGREPRGAIEVEVHTNRERVRIFVTHLGLARRERHAQAEQLLERVDALPADFPVVLMGDFNEWNFKSHWLRNVRARFGEMVSPRTFPSRRPLLALDRIWVRPSNSVHALETVRTPLTRIASDHLPVLATLRSPSSA